MTSSKIKNYLSNLKKIFILYVISLTKYKLRLVLTKLMNLFDNILIKTLGVKKIVLCVVALVKTKEKVLNTNICAYFIFQDIKLVLKMQIPKKQMNQIVFKKLSKIYGSGCPPTKNLYITKNTTNTRNAKVGK